MLTLGSLCTGTGALDQAVRQVLGGQLAWVADPDPGAATLLAHHHPDVPNLGDITAVDWTSIAPVDVITAGFPCFTAGTLVLTSEGYQPIETLQVGDSVLTHTGTWKPITAVMAKDNAELWQVKAGNTITTTAEHPFYVTTRSRGIVAEPGWVEAEHLAPWSSRVGHVLPPVTPPDETDGALWWLAGRYLADGYRQTRTKTGSGRLVRSDQGKVVIACGRGKEPELREQVQRAGLHATESADRNVTKFIFSGPRLYQFVADFGQGAHAKALPGRALSLPADLAEELLGGWLSGDGHRSGSTWHGTTTSKALALGMVLVAHRARGVVASLNCQVPAKTKVIEGRTVNQRPWWRVSIPSNNRRGIVDGDRAWKFVTESAPLEAKARVFNISVEGDESYIADGVIVHNCQDVSCAGRRGGMRVGNRSGLWSHVASSIETLRPSLVFIENVRGLLNAAADSDVEPCPWCLGDPDGTHMRALGAVLADLANLGFDAEWTGVRASEVGSCHARMRIFVLAWPATADPEDDGLAWARNARQRREGSTHRHSAPADTDGHECVRQRPKQPRGATASGGGESPVEWGEYSPAVSHWASVLGRPAPHPVEPSAVSQERLSTRFTEWMMGHPDGTITGVPGLTHGQRSRLIGNGVVPQQGAAGLRLLLDRASSGAVAGVGA